MAQTTVKKLADEFGIPTDRLLTRLEEAGIAAKSVEDSISDDDKLKLLRHLRTAKASAAGADSGAARKISLRRRSTSEIKLSGGRNAPGKTVSVEVRKRRTYVNRAAEEDASKKAEEEIATAKAAEEQAIAEKAAAEVAAAEQAAAEEAARQEAEAAEAARQQAQAEEAAAAELQNKAEPVAAEPEPESTDDEEPEAQAAPQPPAVAPAPEKKMDPARARARENLRRAEQKHGRTKEDEEREAARGKSEEKGKAKGKVKGKELHIAEGKQGRRKKKSRSRPGRVQVQTEHTFERPTAPVIHDVDVPETITVGDLAQRMAVKANELIKEMMKLGVMATINQMIDQDTAILLVEEMGHNAKPVKEADMEESLIEEVKAEESEVEGEPRAPVVTVMGHVDHGKTSLLDYIRREKVVDGEAGGITQHIGAYHVHHDKGTITFIDTPGHAAFTRMRARGAKVTDIAVLVVAADDGVMPQTKESIQHARAAEVPIVVAITKSDVANADFDKVKNGLAAEEVIPEDWGGDVQMVKVSSQTGEGIDDLLDAIILQAEVLELKAPINVPARGVVIESSLEKGRGPVATILIKSGRLKRGDILLAGSHYGRVRAMFDDKGEQVKEAGPSIPVEVLGLSGTPGAGDDAFVVANERKARDIAEQRDDKSRENKLARQQAARLEEVFSQIGEDGATGEAKNLNLLIKADVQGSVEALVESLRKIPSQEVRVRIVASGVGGLSESDVELALASHATVIGFNVRADATARKLIQESGLDVRYYSVIYEAIQDVTDAISGLLGTEQREEIVGLAAVKDVFRSSKLGAIAGCLIEDGVVSRGLPIRVLRDNVVIYEGELESLRRHKDDVNKVEAGTECGIGVKNYNDVKPGDQIECYERTEVQRKVVNEEIA